MQEEYRNHPATLAKDIADRNAKAAERNARTANRLGRWGWWQVRIAVRAIGLIAAILACATATRSIAQAPETCVAYMEAFASHKANRESIYSKHQHKIYNAYKRAQEAERAAWKSARACKSKDGEGWMRCNRGFDDIPDPKDDPNLRLAHKKKDLELEQDKKTFAQAILDIYDGPTSENNSVLWALVKQDIERCHRDGFPMPQ